MSREICTVPSLYRPSTDGLIAGNLNSMYWSCVCDLLKVQLTPSRTWFTIRPSVDGLYWDGTVHISREMHNL